MKKDTFQIMLVCKEQQTTYHKHEYFFIFFQNPYACKIWGNLVLPDFWRLIVKCFGTSCHFNSVLYWHFLLFMLVQKVSNSIKPRLAACQPGYISTCSSAMECRCFSSCLVAVLSFLNETNNSRFALTIFFSLSLKAEIKLLQSRERNEHFWSSNKT